ncbi:hypothetical protein L911_3792 [Vibrio fluvialis I21563]|uniref:Uncharacterized protein n=1 Tax=Vibrio fluvialis PG41 TaxID=1336752 RepID=S7HU39_VIBFL|nr:hypothetical protein L910_3493 [Vibrio fluvialis PG41]EPP19501.1 hypothetical protein L911_3792 [Vibrio fluvialis I21563]
MHAGEFAVEPTFSSLHNLIGKRADKRYGWRQVIATQLGKHSAFT